MMAPRTIGVGPRRPRSCALNSIGARSKECRPDGFFVGFSIGVRDRKRGTKTKRKREILISMAAPFLACGPPRKRSVEQNQHRAAVNGNSWLLVPPKPQTIRQRTNFVRHRQSAEPLRRYSLFAEESARDSAAVRPRRVRVISQVDRQQHRLAE